MQSEPLILNGRYQAERRLGEGGMAVVYSGTDLKLQRRVALKMLRPHLANDAELVARFNQEAQSAAQLNHPNIAAVFDTGQDAGKRYIVMELLPNRTLKQVIAEGPGGRLAPAEAVRIAVEIARALGHAHSHGVVHRDIKPQNILFTNDGHVKVTDFGIARALAASGGTQTGTIMGSPHYLSPEQAQGQPAGPRSDLYSLGVVLYEMLTGRTPFEGESPVAIAVQHLRGTPPPIRSLAPDVPPALEAVVMRAMSREADARFGSAGEMSAALEAAKAGRAPALAATSTLTATPPADATVIMPRLSAPTPQTAPAVPRPQPYTPPEPASNSTAKLVFGLLLFLAIVGGITLGVKMATGGDTPPVTPAAPTPKTPTTHTLLVPDLTGQDATQVRARLDDEYAKLKIAPPQVVEMGQEDSPLMLGQIVRQEPAAGNQIDEGGVIRVWLSSGVEKVSVPDVIGAPLGDAQATLTAKGLSVAQVKQAYNDQYAEGIVCAQNPMPGSPVRQKTGVTLTTSRGPAPPTPPTPPTAPKPPDVSYTPIVTDGEQGKTTVSVSMPKGGGEAKVELRWLAGEHGSLGGGPVKAGEDFSQEVRGPKGAKLGVFVDGAKLKEINF